MNELLIVDLPKGVKTWKYHPHRPMDFVVQRKDQDPEEVRCTMQAPLELGVGDKLLYNGDLPPAFSVLVSKTSNHNAYAVITVRQKGTDSGKDSVGSGSRPEFIA